MQAAQLPEPAAVPVQRPASPALAPALRTISGETPHYRARFEVAAADGAAAAEAVKEIVMGWLHAKGLDVPEGAADIAVPAGWTAADEPDAAKAVRFLGLSGAQGAAWAVEADELDGEFSRRRWHTRIGLAPAGDGGCILNVQVSHYAVNGFFGCQRNPLPSVPRVVRDILANGKLDVRIGASRVSVEEIYLDADTLKRDFMPSLTDRARCLPIVLMTTDDDGKTPVWDATELASKLVGMATVYVIDMRDGSLVQAFRDLLPDRTPAGRYRIGRSAVMVYRPGIDLSTEESLSACTLFTRHRIERYAAGGRDGFINVLMQGLGRGIDARPGDVAGIGDVLWLRSRAESERQGERIERLRSRAKAAADPVADIDGLRAEIARLRSDAEAWEEIATDQERSYSDATAKVDELTRTVKRLEGEKRALERKAAQCAAPSEDDGAARVAECLQAIPRDLTDLLKLALPLAQPYRRPARGNGLRKILRRQPRRGMGYRPRGSDGALRPPVRGRWVRGPSRRRVPAPDGIRAHIQREQRHQGAGRPDEDAREELLRAHRRYLRPHQGKEPEELLPPPLLHRPGKRTDCHRACRMPHEDRRFATPRLQVAEIPAIGNRWRGSFSAHMARPAAQTPRKFAYRRRRRAAYEPGRFWVASKGNAGNVIRGEENMFDTDSDTLRDTEPTETESPKASSADSAADAAKKAADAEKREKRRARQKRQAFTEQMQNLTMDDIRRLMESSVDLGSVSDPQAEIESRIERNGMAYLMKDGAVYAVVLSSDDYERLADKKA